MADNRDNLLLFFYRPAEPCFMQKGEEKAVFDLPDNYYPDDYRRVSDHLANRFGNNAGRNIPVRNIAMPNLTLPMQLPFNSQFSLWVPKHRDMAAKLIDVFMNMRDVEDLTAVCSFCQMRINPYMFNYCLSVAILHRQDTKGVGIPTFAETFPDKFMDPKVFRKAREVTSVNPSGNRTPLIIPVNYTASNLEPEQRVAYFREDIGINLHHWHWHLVYPFSASDRSVVNKDRRGELFYYMHQQIIARYDTERFCNGLSRVRRFNDLRQPIAEAYFPKLDSQIASRAWSPRFAGTALHDLNRPVDQIRIDISQVETWRDRIIQAIERRAAILPNGQTVALDDERGIDILGNMVESSIISPNRDYYGDFHNLGHVFISYAHDPDNRHLEQFGVMGDSATAMRDPVFYRWHSYIDDLFVSFKNQLPPYTNDKLTFPGIRVSGVRVEGRAGDDTFRTFWEQSALELGRGLDFAPRGAVSARFTHLQHDDFNYIIEASNTTGRTVMGTVRIFLTATADEKGIPLTFDAQRRGMIELDKFTATLKTGNNVIRRRSQDSSVTIPYERTFRDQISGHKRPHQLVVHLLVVHLLTDGRGSDALTGLGGQTEVAANYAENQKSNVMQSKKGIPRLQIQSSRPAAAGAPQSAQFDFCGCGWPHHMLLPRGTPRGFPVLLFVMISDWTEDRIEQDLVGSCNDAASYCGIRDRRYPDKRAMGFPFDRPILVNYLEEFLKPNMNVRRCIIRFNDVTVPRGQPQR